MVTKREKNKRRSAKIRKLINEGYPQKQAVAIAYSYEKRGCIGPRGGLKKSCKKRKSRKKSRKKKPKRRTSRKKKPKRRKRTYRMIPELKELSSRSIGYTILDKLNQETRTKEKLKELFRILGRLQDEGVRDDSRKYIIREIERLKKLGYTPETRTRILKKILDDAIFTDPDPDIVRFLISKDFNMGFETCRIKSYFGNVYDYLNTLTEMMIYFNYPRPKVVEILKLLIDRSIEKGEDIRNITLYKDGESYSPLDYYNKVMKGENVEIKELLDTHNYPSIEKYKRRRLKMESSFNSGNNFKDCLNCLCEGKKSLLIIHMNGCPPCKRLLEGSITQLLEKEEYKDRIVKIERNDFDNCEDFKNLLESKGKTVYSYPTIFIVKRDGNNLDIIEEYSGNRTIDNFIEILERASSL